MSLELAGIALLAAEPERAQAFYASLLGTADGSEFADVHGKGSLAVLPVLPVLPDLREAGERSAAEVSGFTGFIVSYVVPQPGEVVALLETATAAGATVLKPAKKGFFGGFTASFRAPDGALWKLASPQKKDTAPGRVPPVPVEIGALLGVADPRASKEFYASLGMTPDRDYGGKFVDFTIRPGICRFGFLPTADLAKDVGVHGEAASPRPVELHAHLPSSSEVDSVLALARSAGGSVVQEGRQDDAGIYRGSFADLDGFVWTLSAS